MTPTTIGLSLAAFCVISLGVMCWMAFMAPYGFEDDAGYHDGEPPEHSDYDGDV